VVKLKFDTLRWCRQKKRLRLIDQRKLPQKFTLFDCYKHKEVAHAIKDLVVRGAPAIGVAAGYGMALAAKEYGNLKGDRFFRKLDLASKILASTRPTAVNLFWALDRQKRIVKQNQAKTPAEIFKLLLEEAFEIHEEDRRMCLAIGENGSRLIPQKATILTHCNAGALATGGIGTALGVIYTAAAEGKELKVFADETRPVLQGARLTAWELRKQGIDTTLICDNMAGSLLRSGAVDLVIVGADRIAKNLDFANKIGTYPLAVMAKEHQVPFYVAAPTSTFDESLPVGSKIVIEERDPSEVLQTGKGKVNVRGLKVYNPAFDVTPASLVNAVITEKGITHGKREK
jgi:methylthioribose-1-phosphate isomerase